MELQDVLDVCRALAPEETALPGDPVGLQVEPETHCPMTTVGVCLDADIATVRRAVGFGAELLISHHPLIYAPLKTILPNNDPVAHAVTLLVKNDMSLYAMHTNWDAAPSGINDTLASLLELQNVTPLGTHGEHSLPRLGELMQPLSLADLLKRVEKKLDCIGTNALRVNDIDPQRTIIRVAVCGGAGAALAADVRAAGADAYVTSDVRHHEWWYAAERGLALIDAGHDATETPGIKALLTQLTEQLPSVNVVWCGPE